MELSHLVGAALISVVFAHGTPALASESPEEPLSSVLSDVEDWTGRSTPAAFVRLIQARTAAAVVVERDLGIDRNVVIAAWSQAPIERQAVVILAIEQLGKPYRYATSDPERGFDCSGLTRYAWSGVGVELPRTSGRQIRAVQNVQTAEPGDLLHYPGHIMLALGIDDYVIHSANRRTGVVLGRASRGVSIGRPDLPQPKPQTLPIPPQSLL